MEPQAQTPSHTVAESEESDRGNRMGTDDKGAQDLALAADSLQCPLAWG